MIALHKGEIPFLLLLLPFVLGISTGLWLWPAVSIPVFTIVLAGPVTLFIFLNLAYQSLKLHLRLRWLGAALIHLILFTAGWLSTSLYDETTSNAHFTKRHFEALVVQLNSEAKSNGKYIRFTACVKQGIIHGHKFSANGNLLVIAPVTNSNTSLNYGDVLLIPNQYTPTTPTYNPAEFSYKQYLAYQNIHYQLFINPGKYALLRHNAGNPVIAYALQLRQHLAEKLKAGIKDTSAAAVASTLMLGYKADLSNTLLQAYSKTGTIHVLSVSGAHVAIIYALIMLLTGFFNHKKQGRVIGAVISITLIWGYSLLTGFSPAACRAALMITLFITGKTFFRHISTLNILAASVFILLLDDPFLLADVGFQLSYFAVFGLLAFQPVIYKQFEIKNKWLNKLWYLCSASVAAQLITFPISIYYFHQFPFYFLISNLFILIPTEIIMVTGIAYLVFYPVPYIAPVIGRVLEYTLILMNKGLLWIEHLPYACATGLWITPTELWILSITIILFIVFLHYKKMLYLNITLLCLLVFSASSGFKKYKVINSDELIFFNLKKHSGIVLRSGQKSVLITDVNRQDVTFLYSLQPYLDSTQINNNLVIDMHQNIKTSFCIKKGGFVQFLNKSILLVDKSFSYIPLSNPIKINYVFVTGSYHLNLNQLSKSYVYDTVIADAGNSKQAIENLQNQAVQKHKYFVCLKRNKSFIVASN